MISKTKHSPGFLEVLGLLATTVGLLASVTILALNSARAKSRDAKCLADIRQMTAALELWAYDNDGSYPGELGKLSPTYIGVIPIAPLPADGICSLEANQYTYKKLAPKQYEVNFCLGGNTAGFMAGNHRLTENGIDQKGEMLLFETTELKQ